MSAIPVERSPQILLRLSLELRLTRGTAKQVILSLVREDDVRAVSIDALAAYRVDVLCRVGVAAGSAFSVASVADVGAATDAHHQIEEHREEQE